MTKTQNGYLKFWALEFGIYLEFTRLRFTKGKASARSLAEWPAEVPKERRWGICNLEFHF